MTFAASTRLAGSGGLDVARDLLEQVFDESEAADMFEQLESSIAEAPFNFMRKMDPSQIISFIKDEHPQIIAIVLAYLPSDLASNVLASMQEEVQGTVAERIGMMGRVNPDAVRLVEGILQRKMSNVLVTTESSYIGGIDPLISIIQRTDRQTEKILLEAIEERDPKLAETIRANLFLFEDVAKIDDRSLQVVLRGQPQDLAMSLKRVSEEVHEKVLGNLSRRAAQMLEEELELMGRCAAAAWRRLRERSLQSFGDLRTRATSKSMWVVLMISSLRVTRVSPDRAQSLSPARLDYALSDGPLAQGTVMDPRIVNPQLEEIVSEAVRRAETEARERGYAVGYQQARDEITATVRDELGRENEILRAEHEALMANQADVRNQLLEAVQLMQALTQEMDTSFVPTYESVGQDLADVVVALVEDLLGRRLAEDRAHVLGAITRAVAEIPESGRLPCVSIQTTPLCWKDLMLIWRVP